MKFRKRPVVVEATPVEFVLAAAKLDDSVYPDWIRAAIDEQKLTVYETIVTVRTLEGVMRGESDDWLIQGVNGEIYPCKNEIFVKTYERTDE